MNAEKQISPEQIALSKSPIMIQGDVIKYVYAGTLHLLPLETLRSFWNQFPPPSISKKHDEITLFTALWETEKWIPLSYFVTIINNLGLLLDKINIRDIDFMKAMCQEVSNGIMLPASAILGWSKPFLSLFFSKDNIRLLILRLLGYTTTQISPHIINRLVKNEVIGKDLRSVILFMHAKVARNTMTQKRKIFAARLPGFDAELWTAMLVESLPSYFKMPNYENRFILSDLRKIEDIIPDAAIEHKKGALIIDGEVFGVATTFQAFCTEKKLDLSPFEIPDFKVIKITKNYTCPRRNRVILHRDCVYNAPVFLYGFQYTNEISKPKNLLAGLVEDAITPNPGSWQNAKNSHQQLLNLVSHKAIFVYKRSDQSLSINGNHFITNIPAKLLKKMLVAHVASGKTVFSHRELVSDRTIFSDKKAANLAVRLQRIAQMFEEHFPKIVLAKAARGQIVLKTKCKIELIES